MANWNALVHFIAPSELLHIRNRLIDSSGIAKRLEAKSGDQSRPTSSEYPNYYAKDNSIVGDAASANNVCVHYHLQFLVSNSLCVSHSHQAQ